LDPHKLVEVSIAKDNEISSFEGFFVAMKLTFFKQNRIAFLNHLRQFD